MFEAGLLQSRLQLARIVALLLTKQCQGRRNY